MCDEIFGIDLDFDFRRVENRDRELLKEFVCEDGAIAKFIHEESIDSDRDVTYIFVDKKKNNVICYCSICCNGISVAEYDNQEERCYNTNIPAIEIDFFAIDERYRSMRLTQNSTKYETLSKALFLYMIQHIRYLATNVVGAQYICLYSVPKAVNFYKRCGFNKFEDYMIEDTKPFVDGCIPMFLNL